MPPLEPKEVYQALCFLFMVRTTKYAVCCCCLFVCFLKDLSIFLWLLISLKKKKNWYFKWIYIGFISHSLWLVHREGQCDILWDDCAVQIPLDLINTEGEIVSILLVFLYNIYCCLPCEHKIFLIFFFW